MQDFRRSKARPAVEIPLDRGQAFFHLQHEPAFLR